MSRDSSTDPASSQQIANYLNRSACCELLSRVRSSVKLIRGICCCSLSANLRHLLTRDMSLLSWQPDSSTQTQHRKALRSQSRGFHFIISVTTSRSAWTWRRVDRYKYFKLNCCIFKEDKVYLHPRQNKLHGLSPRANYTDRATAACRLSDCQLLRIKGATWSAW
jgi:hypothetical protein